MPKQTKRIDPVTGRVLQKGEYARPNGGYQYKSWNPETRKSEQVSAKTLDELRELEKELMRNRLTGVKTGNRITLNDYYAIWKHNKHVKPNVMSNYCYMYMRYVEPVLGKKNIKDIKYSTVQSFYNGLLDREVLAINTLEVVHNVLHQIMELAVRDDVIRRNVTDGLLAEIKRNRPAPKRKEGLTLEEQERLLEVLEDPEFKVWRPMFLFLLNTGLRVSEMAGLTWDDIDYDNNLIHVRRNLKYYPDENRNSVHAISTTKTTTSHRDIPLTDKIKDILEMQRRDGNACTECIDGVSGFIFGNRFGGVHHQGSVNRAIKRIVRKANADPDAVPLPSFSSHTFRHTITTNMIYAGVELTAAANILGHKDIKTTANIYNRVLNEQKRNAMDALDQFSQKMDYEKNEKKKRK
ncbi:MAG: site-specific integrase [Clostridiales bacterium]|nr:site-specific integrase [Clostridiales bacterium]